MIFCKDSQVEGLKQENATLRKQLAQQTELAAEYRKLHQSASVRKQELFAAIRRLQAVIEEAMG